MNDRLAAASDRLEIQDLIVRYCIAVDDRDLDAVADMFLPDATFSAVGDPPRGREEIKIYYAARLERYGMTYHYPHGVTITLDSDTEAHGVVLAHAEVSIDGRHFVIAMRYHDRYERFEGAWRFAERQVRPFYVLPHDELSSGVGETLRVRWPGTEPQPATLPDTVPTWQSFVAARR